MKNEVRFLIAYYYSLMLEVYGPFPFKPGVIEDVNAPADSLLIPQTQMCIRDRESLSKKIRGRGLHKGGLKNGIIIILNQQRFWNKI